MRGAGRPEAPEEEGESVFVSMTDMTVSFLFIVMILLAFFATQIGDDDVDGLRRRLAEAERALAETRDDLAASRAEAQALRAERARLQADRDALAARVAALQASVATLEARLTQAATDLSAARREAATLRTARDRLREELAALEAVRRDAYQAYVSASLAARTELLTEISSVFPADLVEISPENDALRFVGDGLFASGAPRISRDKLGYVEALAEKLDALLPCYTRGARPKTCAGRNRGFAIVESVLIEGHTDRRRDDQFNLELSNARSANTFRVMRTHRPGLLDHLNWRNQPVLSLAGYGEFRPVEPTDDDIPEPRNRRIDLRIIMYAPADLAELARIEAEMRAALDRGGSP